VLLLFIYCLFRFQVIRHCHCQSAASLGEPCCAGTKKEEDNIDGRKIAEIQTSLSMHSPYEGQRVYHASHLIDQPLKFSSMFSTRRRAVLIVSMAANKPWFYVHRKKWELLAAAGHNLLFSLTPFSIG
jgi:hypothetical protein